MYDRNTLTRVKDMNRMTRVTYLSSYLEWVSHQDFKNVAYVGFFRHFLCVFVFVVVFVIVFVFVFVFSDDFCIAFIISFQNMYGYILYITNLLRLNRKWSTYNRGSNDNFKFWWINYFPNCHNGFRKRLLSIDVRFPSVNAKQAIGNIVNMIRKQD